MSIPKLVRADNGYYYAVWSEGRRSRRESMGCKEAAQAQTRFAQWILLRGQQQKAGAEYTVGELWAVYCEHHAVVADETRSYSWNNLKPHFGGLPLSGVTGDVVRDYRRKRESGKIGRPSVSSTIRRELNAMRACFSWCAADAQKIIEKGAMPAYELPPDGEPRDRWLSLAEMQKLLNAAGARRGDRLPAIYLFLWIALETAARKTAIFELTWDRVDFETNVIHYDVPGRKKTKKRRTSPPISKSLRPILERAYRERTGPLVLGGVANVNKTLERVAEKAGVADVSPHVLRHTAATHMARRGVPLWKIAGVLGNTLAMVESVYAKHSPDAQREAVEMISGELLEMAE